MGTQEFYHKFATAFPFELNFLKYGNSLNALSFLDYIDVEKTASKEKLLKYAEAHPGMDEYTLSLIKDYKIKNEEQSI